MPELPDLTLFAENIHRRFAGRAVDAAEYHKPKRLNVTPEVLHETLTGKTLKAVQRDGKGLVLDFGGDVRVDVHLMLKGELAGADRDEASTVPYRVLSLHFTDGAESLFVCDSMALTTVSLSTTPPTDSTIPDALEVSAEHLQKHANRLARTPIKGLLIDQSVVRGIGNAYADEILYVARVSPKSLSGTIPAEAIARISDATRSVLEDAIVQLRTFRPDATGGEYRDFLRLHHPTRTHTDSGFLILKSEVAKKATCYTDEQELYT